MVHNTHSIAVWHTWARMHLWQIQGLKRAVHAPAGDCAPNEEELAEATSLMAELALLGGGDADRIFPASLDDAYAAGADEAEWRVMM